MFQNVPLKNIELSKINFELTNYNFQNYIYNYFKTDFLLNTQLLLPISLKTNLSSVELFGYLYHKKYSHFFDKDYYNLINQNLNNFQIYSKSFIIGSSDNYYHLVIDILPKIFGYNPFIEKYVNNIIIFNSKLQKSNILETVLKKKNVKSKVLTIEHGTYKFFDSFFTVKQSLTNIIFNYRKLFKEVLKNKPQKNIYISRSDANQRKVLNEDELIENIKKLNFEIVNLSELSFFEQLSLFNSAKCILSLHGAGLTNLIFSNKKTRVIEIFPDFLNSSEDWYCNSNNDKFNINTVRRHFIDISKIINLDHTIYFTSKYKKKNNEKEFQMKSNEKNIISITSTDVIIDIPFIMKLLKTKINF